LEAEILRFHLAFYCSVHVWRHPRQHPWYYDFMALYKSVYYYYSSSLLSTLSLV